MHSSRQIQRQSDFPARTPEMDEWPLETEGPKIDFFTASSLGLRDIVRYHVARGQEINEQNKSGWTALMYACAAKKNHLVSYFLNLGADITLMDHHGKHFILVAAENSNLQAVRLLKNWIGTILEHPSKGGPHKIKLTSKMIDVKEEEFGLTPLMFAASLGDDEMVEELLHLGADPETRDIEGRKPAELALSSGHNKTAWLLKLHGASVTTNEILVEIGLEKYSHLFTNVTTDALMRFGEEDLISLGLRLLGPRKKILLMIEKLKNQKFRRHETMELLGNRLTAQEPSRFACRRPLRLGASLSPNIRYF